MSARSGSVASSTRVSFRSVRERLARLAPEEIAGGVFLVVALLAVALQPAAIGRIFESPYATPAPESGATTFLRTQAVDTTLPSDRVITRRALPQPAQIRSVFLGGSSGVVPRVVQVADVCSGTAASVVNTGGANFVVCMPTAPILLSPPAIRAPSP
jgi:hypothetical protein